MNIQAKHSAHRITAHYAAAFGIYFGAFCMVRSFITVYLLDRGFSYTQIGIISAVHMFFSAVIQPLFSQILNHFPRIGLRRFIALCCVPCMLSSLLTFFVPANMVLFTLLYVIFGLFEIGLQALMVSVGMEYVNAGIPINPGLGRGIGSAGYAVFNVLLGALIVRYGSAVAHKLNIVLLLILCALLVTLPDPGTGERNRPDPENASGEKADSPASFLKNNPVFSVFILSAVLIFFGHSIVNTYMPDIAARFGLGSDFTGLMNGLAAILELIPMFLFVYISRKISPLSLLQFSAVFFFIKILTTTLAGNAAGIALGQTMQIFAYATYVMASIYFTNQAVKETDRVLAQGMLIGAGEIGFMIGSLTGGLILDAADIRTLLWIGTAVTAAGSILMCSAIGKFKN